jgi:O-Antigen ligase
LRLSTEANRSGLHVPERARLAALCMGAMAAAAATGAFIALHDAMSSLRGIVGLSIIASWLRYPYFLLLSWAVIDPFFGSSVTLVNGSNLDLALTVSTLLLVPTFPIKQMFKRVPALPVFLLFLSWVLLGISASPLDHAAFLKQWILLVDTAAVAVLAINILSTGWRLSRFIDMLLVAPVGIALYGIYGYVMHQNVIVTGTGPARITAIFSSAPPLALLLSNLIPLALFRVFTARRVERVVAFLAVCILLAAVGLTFSRGAIVSVAVCLLVAIIVFPSRRMKLAILGLGALVALVAAAGNLSLLERFSSTDVVTLNGRSYLWNAVLQNFDPTQLAGQGLGASTTLLTGLHIGNNGQLGNGLIANSVSNLYLGTLYDQGFIGLGLLALTFITLAASSIRGLRRTSGEHQALFAVGLLTLVNVVIQSIDLNDFLGQSIAVDFWVIVVALPFARCWSRSPMLKRVGEKLPEGKVTSQYGPAPEPGHPTA